MVDTPGAEEPFSPDITHVNPADEKNWFGHPRQLARLFTTEMWERFGFYGMRALLSSISTKHFLFSDHQATGLYGGYTALVYLTPLVGGWLADHYLGSKRSVKCGALVMAIGLFHAGASAAQPAKPYATIDGAAIRSRRRSLRRSAVERSERSAIHRRRWAEAEDPRQ